MADTLAPDHLPVLDIERLDRGPSERDGFLADLRAAARGPGFFYLSGHGIDPALIEDLRDLARHFFNLPDAEKLSIAMVNSPHFRGYYRAGLEHTRGKPDWREQVDIVPERPALDTGPGAPAWARLQHPNQWLEALHELRGVVLAYQEAATALAVRVLLRGGYGGLVGFELRGGVAAGRAFIDALKLFHHVANIGDARSLAIHPASTTHSQLDPDDQLKTGVTPGYVRLSIGLEHPDDIVADLAQALDAARAAAPGTAAGLKAA